MPEVEYSTTARLPVEVIWDFVRDMDNWAAFVAGYQHHEKRGEDDSFWSLRGDVGMVTRKVDFEVHVEEWAGPERVRFALKGVNEPMEGAGTFELAPYEGSAEEDAAGSADAAAVVPAAPRPGLFARLLEALARLFFRRAHGEVRRAESADSGPAAGTSRLTFRLRITPGGPMGPMVDKMMAPMMKPAAEDLANRIMATLEERHGLT